MFKLLNTYELLVDFNSTSRPIRIEVFRNVENKNIFRARVWDQATYNLYPTFANIDPEGGIKNEMFSCDHINQEITVTIAKDSTLITGKEYSSEAAFVEYIKELINEYQAQLSE